ncbi:hypothetical protein [Arthrobacter sp.]|uniref:hypothetical protein n=1 Tax=Arthrobacter sp. TaxID=1667 RepID=UPI002810A6ED|nr:hypothetical protein [Arthrobacter sp.]
MPHPALKLPPTPDHDFPPRPSHDEATALESLTDIRTSLAGDVLAFLTATTTSPPAPQGEVLPDNADERVTERQVLLRAAIADLKVMDVRLHHDRH